MHSPLERLLADYTQALEGRSGEDLEVHPQADAAHWNGRQIVEHLCLTYRSCCGLFRERLAKGRPTQSRPTGWQRVKQLFVFELGYFPEGLPAPLAVTPRAIVDQPRDGSAILDTLKTELQAMDDLLVECKGRFGRRRFASHQELGALSARQWVRFHAVHGRHHLKQMKSLGFGVSERS